MIPSIVLLGNLLVDDVVLADGTTRMGQSGGALLYGALGATLWESRPGLVSVLGDDYPARVLEMLEERGVDLTGVHPLGRPGVRTWLLYEGPVRRLIHRLGCPAHEEVSPRPALIPSEWTAARAFHLAPMPFDVQRALLTALRARPAFVSIDPHLPVTEETLHEWRAGDAFGVALILAHLEGLPIEACLQRAVVTASFAVAGWGPEALLAATRADAEARLRQWYGSEGQR